MELVKTEESEKQDVENFLKPRKQNTSTPFVEENFNSK